MGFFASESIIIVKIGGGGGGSESIMIYRFFYSNIPVTNELNLFIRITSGYGWEIVKHI